MPGRLGSAPHSVIGFLALCYQPSDDVAARHLVGAPGRREAAGHGLTAASARAAGLQLRIRDAEFLDHLLDGALLVGSLDVAQQLRWRAGDVVDGPPTTEAAICKALKKGDTGIRKIATTLGVGTGTVQRIKAEMSARA
jgi:hypothetical protein